MSTWLRRRWLRLRESLWFIPGVMTLLAIAAAFGTLVLDRRLLASGHAREMWFVFGVGAEGVRGVLSAIAGSIITVTGVVFSITIVALQLASTQFTPRVLRTFLEDRANHVVLGVFIGTFTYVLVVLRFVRADSERLTAFVPSVSVTVSMLLALASIACLIFFIDHSAHSIRASTIIERLVDDAVSMAHRAFPRDIGEPAAAAAEVAPPSGPGLPVRSRTRGYLQVVDEDALLALDEQGPVVVRMEGRIGDYVRTSDVLATVWGARDGDDRGTAERVRAAFVLGSEPTAPQDVALGIARLVEIAVKALSPGINDPGTALMCIDGLGEVLSQLAGREAPSPVRDARGGAVRLVAQRPTFDELAALAFAQVRHHGAGTPVVVERLLTMAATVAARCGDARRDMMVREAMRVARAAGAALPDPDDRERIAELARAVGRDP